MAKKKGKEKQNKPKRTPDTTKKTDLSSKGNSSATAMDNNELMGLGSSQPKEDEETRTFALRNSTMSHAVS
jgi:hypothetical protein